MSAVLAIAFADIRPACRGEADVVERIRKAMLKAQDFWMSIDDDIRFRGAVGAAMLETADAVEKERIERSIRAVRSFSALLSGVPVDVEAIVRDAGEDVIPLMRMWQEAKESKP